MLLDFLSQYLGNIEAAVRKLEDIYVERYEEERGAEPTRKKAQRLPICIGK